MRLLERNNAGDFSLTKDFLRDDVPRYAILSHTWGADTEEVTFEDLMNGTSKHKTGYDKIRFCGEQARHDDLQYFWVDTCCINKSNNTELSEAINSMFRWYQNAVKCYVYLSDVPRAAFDANDELNQLRWELDFRESRWFTRGWTLQELLAPGSVEFFSRKGRRLGDKRTLERQIHEITGIALSALQGTPLSQFSVDERLAWAKNRQTTRKEDEAYSLLGIFNVYMPLIYGEGRDNAFTRLRDEIDKPSRGMYAHYSGHHPTRQSGRALTVNSGLDRLPYAVEAPFNSHSRQHEPICLEHTRVDVLHEIYNWTARQDKRCIFWLNGLAGTGKSTIARTVARTYSERGRLGASFFFSKGGGDVGHAGKFFTSIAVQLARNVATLSRHICEAIAAHSNIASQSLYDQWRQLILGPLSKLDGRSCQPSYILVVDALDECSNDNDIRVILRLLAEAGSLRTVKLQVFLTSRPEIPIRYGLCQISDAEHQDFVLHNISPSIISHDISLFLAHDLALIGQENSLEAGWPGAEAIQRLVQRASGLFIWAATACRFIREGRNFATDRLSIILKDSSMDEFFTDDSATDDDSNDDPAVAPEEHLNKLYLTVLRNSARNYKKQEKKRWYKLLKTTIGTITVLFSPLSTSSLAGVLHVRREEVIRRLNDLHSILAIPEERAQPIRLQHPSFRDFLFDEKRCADSNFWVDEKQAHQTLAANCIRLMSNSLKQDIYDLGTPGALVTDIENNQVEQCLSPEVQYACLYWIDHLQKSGAQLYDNDLVHQFLEMHLLHWLEALSWIRKISEGILAITSLESIALVSQLPA